MTPLAIVLILTIAAGGAAGLVFVGVLIQWSLRKALPSRPVHAEIEAAPPPETEPILPPPELAPVTIATLPVSLAISTDLPS